MGKKQASDIAEFLDRADTGAIPKNVPVQKNQARQATPEQRRDVYDGNLKPPSAQQREYVVPRGNKKIVAPRKRRSTFNIVAVLFLAAIAVVLYIGNILTVDRLAVEVNLLQSQFDRIQNANNILLSEISRKSAFGRIGEVAKQQGLTYAKQSPQTFNVDEDKLEKFKEK